MAKTTPIVVIVMGVAGAGKTTVGRALADALGWPFYDGDDFHSPTNVARMASGIPLTDADREPWLAAMNAFAHQQVSHGRSIVLASSALRCAYRERLRLDLPDVRFVYLKADPDVVRRRLQERAGHFMKGDMLNSQLATLEEPVEAVIVDADWPVDTIVSTVIDELEFSAS